MAMVNLQDYKMGITLKLDPRTINRDKRRERKRKKKKKENQYTSLKSKRDGYCCQKCHIYDLKNKQGRQGNPGAQILVSIIQGTGMGHSRNRNGTFKEQEWDMNAGTTIRGKPSLLRMPNFAPCMP